jgi:hypothetical protein
MSAYIVTGTDIEHDGKRHAEGAQVELDDAVATKLARWLKPASVAAKTPAAGKTSTAGGKTGSKQ